MPPTPKAEEKKLTLPPGHPQAGYTGTDPSAADDGVGTLAPELQDWKDKQQEAYEEQRDAIAENEDKVAKDEQAAAEKAAADAAKAETQTPPKATSGSSSSGS